MKILNYNVGLFFFFRYIKFLKLKSIKNEYFNPNLNGEFISDFIEKTNPDILFLQEIYNKNDIENINSLKKYPHREFVNTWYHKHSILIASKEKFSIFAKDKFHIISINNFNFLPIHLNSFSAKKRLMDANILNNISQEINNLIILGDTNIWKKENNFIFKNDKKSYKKLSEYLTEFSSKIKSTTYINFKLDMIFGSKNLQISNIKCPKIRGKLMDHYPIIFNLDN
jgi:endonuclease/exonuclease/phosphatase family metal-dependent hydrolase